MTSKATRGGCEHPKGACMNTPEKGHKLCTTHERAADIPVKGDWIECEATRQRALGAVKVIRVWPLGTIDVESRTGKCYRITGLYKAGWPS